MSQSWRLLTLAMLLSPVMHKVTARTGKSRISDEFSIMVKMRRMQMKILQGLNMTEAPSTRMLTPDSNKVKVKRPTIQESAVKQPNVTMILLSQSADDQRMDTLSFKLDSRLQNRSNNIEEALLVVCLRSYRDKDDHMSELLTQIRRRRNELNLGYLDSKPSKNPLNNTHLLINITAGNNENAVNAGDGNGLGNPIRKQKLRRLKTRRVKVVVKIVDPETGKKRKVAAQIVRVQKKARMIVPVPLDLLISAVNSSNHTLTVQLTCKRCKRRVHIEKVFKNAKRKTKEDERMRRLNPNRPFLFITTGNNVSTTKLISSGESQGTPYKLVPNKISKRHVSNSFTFKYS